MAQDEEMRALQRENGAAGQRTADLRERLNFQCFKYELLVDMVCSLVLGLLEAKHALAIPLSRPANRSLQINALYSAVLANTLYSMLTMKYAQSCLRHCLKALARSRQRLTVCQALYVLIAIGQSVGSCCSGP